MGVQGMIFACLCRERESANLSELEASGPRFEPDYEVCQPDSRHILCYGLFVTLFAEMVVLPPYSVLWIFRYII